MTEQKEGFSIQEKLTKRQKYFQFIGVPILLYIVFYLFYQLLIHFFHMETHDSLTLETLAVTLGVSIVHWIGLVYPSKPASESTKSNKSLKEYIKQYVIKGTSFIE